jgi:vacuolar protein sorting-associated protein VTA1
LRIHFLLLTHPQNEEKIRYAKWKAADIAKALREGRKPIPGPANSGPEIPTPPAVRSSDTAPTLIQPATPPAPDPPQVTTSQHTPPAIAHTPLPPHIHASDIAHDNVIEPHTPPRRAYLGIPQDGQDTPGNWSTVATPGTVDATPYIDDEGSGVVGEWEGSPLQDRLRSGENRNSESGSPPALPGRPDDVFSDDRADDVLGVGLGDRHGAGSPTELRPSSPPSLPDLLPFTPTAPPLPPPPPPPALPPPPPPTLSPQVPMYYPRPPSPPAPEPDTEVDLTPEVITKAQKHMRFAISALDYEDLEQSRKELRTALAILGGR